MLKIMILKRNLKLKYILIFIIFFVIIVLKINLTCVFDQTKLLEEQIKGPVSSNDIHLINYIKKRYLKPPSNKNYSFHSLTDYGYQMVKTIHLKENMSKVISQIYPVESGLRNGFFVEAGALDGELGSVSLYLEMKLGWTGLLVEPNYKMFSHLINKNRKAWSCNCCLATKPFPIQTQLGVLSSASRKNDDEIFHSFSALIESKHSSDIFKLDLVGYETVQCLPTESLLKALQVTKVDLFSLDVEDAEVGVLEYFPWDTVSVNTWVIEHRHSKKGYSLNEDFVDHDFVQWFVNKGYKLHAVFRTVPHHYIFTKDKEKL